MGIFLNRISESYPSIVALGGLMSEVISQFVSSCIHGSPPSPTDPVTVSVRVPSYQVAELDYIARHLGVSRQVLMAQLLTASQLDIVNHIADVLEGDPEKGISASHEFLSGYESIESTALYGGES